ncbi:DUF2934 domain-containing protein [Mycoplana dimorpha]|uniref:DUF2934 domain-containing protein n=1 Tax=Mycoplana dimorpha TaxID=28320 RepID=UPI000D393577|nr:DUF2934 domain-containing protein [Mycoplana dimorpha]
MPSRNGTDRDEEIRRRAYGLWESQGRPEGSQERHWQQAEHELEAEERAKVAPASRSRTASTRPAAGR